MTKKEQYFEWLRKGVQHGVITEARAKKFYIEVHGYIGHMEFLEKLYERY